jgi:type I restriction enzyme R subunit
MEQHNLSETDIRTKFITPAIVGPDGSKWNPMTRTLQELHDFTSDRGTVRRSSAQRRSHEARP